MSNGKQSGYTGINDPDLSMVFNGTTDSSLNPLASWYAYQFGQRVSTENNLYISNIFQFGHWVLTPTTDSSINPLASWYAFQFVQRSQLGITGIFPTYSSLDIGF